MPNTYTELARQTLGTAATSVTFSSIPATYTDLFLVATTVGASLDALVLQFNADTGTNYSTTILYGTGSSAASARETNSTYVYTGLSGSAMSQSTYNIMNYANTTTFKTTIGRGDAANGQVRAGVSLWRSTSAINSIKVFRTANNNMDAGSTFSLYGIANADLGAAKATGGIITEDANYWYHTFGASGAFVPKQSLTCDVLVVAGGGGGGDWASGGGGAGGVSYINGLSISTNTTVTIGAGGAQNVSGSNSVFGNIISNGGGRGGTNSTPVNGGSGGSGGGAAINATGGSANQGNTGGATGYGNNGGSSTSAAEPYSSAGGGGAGGAGGSVSTSPGGAGGVGITNSTINTLNAFGAATSTGQLSGGNYYYAGGGGGASSSGQGAGGLGGGGAGINNAGAAATAGTVNTGGGGGGQRQLFTGGAGGSGIIIVRYAK